ncbi:MAG TPA: TetR/AcrR family transcriptional regulator [Pyrinomonadaceae bacterium]|nr:TetR/AcrR family transcriptional regulator [Pyrinomonadaceae bacterium]
MIKELDTAAANEAPHGTRMSGDERRSLILQVAIKLFSQNGFRGTTTKEIARAAGVSEAMVFRHFATKNELYHAILDHKACEGKTANPMESICEALLAKDDEEVFYRMILEALDKHEGDPEFMRLLFHAALEGHELADIFIEENIVPIYEFMSEYIAQRQKDGAIRANINPRVVVRAIVGMMIHHALNNSLWDRKRRLLDISNAEAAKNFAEILLRGIKN